MAHILSDEAARWPSLGHPNILEIGRPAAVKTGFTADQRSTWTLGATPQLAVGVWMGFPDPESEGQLTPNQPAGIWHALLQYASADQQTESWVAPPGIVEIDVCDPSGMLPTDNCPAVVREVFMTGNEPTQADTLFQKVEINRETGRLATVFTPPGLIEARIYLVPPPEAAGWAQQAGLPIPPEDYDLVSEPAAPLETVRIASPAMFDSVRGEIGILGTAAGDDFASFNLQVGRGLNPQQWILLGSGQQTAVENGELGRWDTSGLTGLYTLRLQVVRTDQRLDTMVIQLTVDNQPPEVSILYPEDRQAFAYPQDQTATFQFGAADDLALERIEVYLDNVLIRTLAQPPFAVPWELAFGTHTLRVVGYDRAGNTAQDSLTFTYTR
jgi:membrane carboxypeptidase/penicillin-binding protein PbpC